MHPELFELPFIHVSIKSFGVMMVAGFLFAVMLTRRLSKMAGQDPERITSVGLYGLVSGVVGARIFFVIHHWQGSMGDFLSVFAVWQGGLELLGGVILGTAVVFSYLLWKRLPVRLYLDILALGLMLGLAFGRVGCFLYGDCFGRPSEVSWAVHFPYGSPAYSAQVRPDAGRNRSEPYIELPAEYYGWSNGEKGGWVEADEERKYLGYLKPYELLTERQKAEVGGKYRAVGIHPTQLYSSGNALALCGVLYVFWRKFGVRHPGSTVSLMFALYGPMRFVLEGLRDDNPFEHAWWSIRDGWTVSQNLGIYLAIVGVAGFVAALRKKKVSG